MKRLNDIPANTLLLIFLGVWWAVNLLQAGFTELANDEAYYYIFSLDPAWGYFDHPPVTAWLVWLGTHLFGATAFGVRAFFTLLQPLYLLILFRIVKPANYTARDVMLYGVICCAMPILQLYGFITVPDGPLLFASALFLLCFKRFTQRNSVGEALLMGVSVALLAYSKYHGALVVLFALAACPKLLLNPKLYLAGAVAIVLMIPHLLWQYNHDWASLGYHLAGRNKAFQLSYITDYVMNLLLVFNPLFVPLYVQGWRKMRSRNATERAILWIGAGLIIFFLLSSFRGYVQPQWVICSTFALIMVLFNYSREHTRTHRFVMRAGWTTIALVCMVRIVMIFNPGHLIRFEIFDNRQTYGAIHQAAAGRPVIFSGNYAIAAKYIFYTGGEAYCQAQLGNRTSQWQFIDNDTRMVGREVLVEISPDAPQATPIALANGKKFCYTAVPGFIPLRKAEVKYDALQGKVRSGETLFTSVIISNPYPYSIAIGRDSVALQMVWWREKTRGEVGRIPVATDAVIPAGGQRRIKVMIDLPATEPGRYRVGFTLARPPVGSWFNSREQHITVE